MTYSPPEPEQQPAAPSTGEQQEAEYGVDTSRVSWRDEDQWEARPPDDDSRWRHTGGTDAAEPSNFANARTRDEAVAVQACEAHLQRALKKERPLTLLGSIYDSGCIALKGSKADPSKCARCRLCPKEGLWQHIQGYYNPQKGRVTLCAEKGMGEQQVEDTLTHELVHAYDHCRFSMRVPMVGRQHPWALTCAASACSEVRAYLIGDGWRGPSAPPAFEAPVLLSGLSDGSVSTASVEHRGEIYRHALASTLSYGTCADKKTGPQGTKSILDAVFYACLSDHAPFTHSKPLPQQAPMPSEVAAADK